MTAAWALIASALLLLAALLLRPARSAYIALSCPAIIDVPDYDHRRPECGYPLINRGKQREIESGRFAMPPFDRCGIPVTDYRWQRWPLMPRGRFYNAVTVAQYALWAHFMRFVETGDPASKDRFLALAEWLAANQDDAGRYRNEFAHAAYNQPVGWISGMTQGMAVSVLVRAWLLTGREHFLVAAERAMSPFHSRVADGGVVWMDEIGTWIEEVPEAEPSHVFNGLVFGWYGVWDYVAATGDSRATDLLEHVEETLRLNLDRYETDEGVRYELKRSFIVNRDAYLPIQIGQLRSLSKMTGDGAFDLKADEWTHFLPATRHIGLFGKLARALVMAAVYRLEQLRSWMPSRGVVQ